MSNGRVFLVDDDANIVRALKLLLKEADFDVEAFQSVEAFLIQHDMKMPGCAVFDVGLGEWNGVDLLRALARRGQMRPTIFITGRDDIATSVRAMKSGAVDFLTKPVRTADLFEAVRNGVERDRRDREQGTKIAPIAKRLSSLSPRESEVLKRVIAGLLNKQIAGELGIAEKTVKVHRGRVMAKMGVRSVADLVRTVEPVLIHLLSGGRPLADPEKRGALRA
jgi:FixJ family two-component response regulator